MDTQPTYRAAYIDATMKQAERAQREIHVAYLGNGVEPDAVEVVGGCWKSKKAAAGFWGWQLVPPQIPDPWFVSW